MLPQRLRQARKSKKLTQTELAKLVNTKKSTISNYETGYSTPSNEMLKDLADVLDTTTDYLLGRVNEPEDTDHSHIFTKEELNFIDDSELPLKDLMRKYNIDDIEEFTEDEIRIAFETIKAYKKSKQK